MPSEHDLVSIRFYDDPMEAHLARCLLENEGIAAFVHDENIVGLNRAFSYAVGGVKLKVQEMDRGEALKVLDSMDHRPFLDEEELPVTCPKCGATELTSRIVAPRTAKGMFHWVVAVLFAVYPMSVEPQFQCDRCGHVFPRARDTANAKRPDA